MIVPFQWISNIYIRWQPFFAFKPNVCANFKQGAGKMSVFTTTSLNLWAEREFNYTILIRDANAKVAISEDGDSSVENVRLEKLNENGEMLVNVSEERYKITISKTYFQASRLNLEAPKRGKTKHKID